MEGKPNKDNNNNIIVPLDIDEKDSDFYFDDYSTSRKYMDHNDHELELSEHDYIDDKSTFIKYMASDDHRSDCSEDDDEYMQSFIEDEDAPPTSSSAL